MSFARTHNIGGVIDAAGASDNTALTAGGAGDNVQVVGLTLDRTILGSGATAKSESASLILRYKAVLGAAATLSLKTVKIQTGALANGTDMADFATFTPDFVSSAGAATIRGRQKYDVDLAGAKQYVRCVYTPDLSAANTDTAEVAAVLVFGGLDLVP